MIAPTTGPGRRRRWITRTGVFIVLFLAGVALLAPLLASNRPLLVIEPAGLRWPAFSSAPEYQHLRPDHFRNLRSEDEVRMWMPPVPYHPDEIDWEALLAPPSARHWLGTDDQGRDVLARLIHGTQVSLLVGLVPAAIYLPLGIFLGTLAGYRGGRTDLAICRIMEVTECFPQLFLYLTIMAFLGPGLANLLLLFGLLGWTGVARVVRGEMLRLRGRDHVLAAQALGFGPARIMWRHLLPHATAPLLVLVVFRIAGTITAEVGLSFLGFGVQPPTASWGSMLAVGHEYLTVPGCAHLATCPGLAILVAVLGYNLVGEGLRDLADPRMP